jgi:hypothetical protein
VRLAAEPFVLDDFDNKFVHLTNIDQQKDHPEFDKLVFKWTFAELEEYLRCHNEAVNPG